MRRGAGGRFFLFPALLSKHLFDKDPGALVIIKWAAATTVLRDML